MDEAARRQTMEDCDRSSWAYWALFLHRWDVDLTGENDDGEEKEEQESDDSPDISLEDMEAQDLGW